jgi:SAM-dependent methyltransferase
VVQQNFFAESAAYERFMGRWSRQVAPLLVQFADIRDGQPVLDVGSGTGALALAAAQVAPSAQITGVDPSASYVSNAQGRAPTERVRFAVGDAQALQIPDATFDRVVSLFVMNFIPDRAKALREMIRVTRPDGVIAAAVWDYGDGMQMLRVFWDEAVALDPAAAARDEGNMPLCRSGELAALWREHGFAQVEERPLTIRMSFSSFEDYWEPFLGGQGPAGAYVASLTAARRDALRNRIRQRLVGDGPDRPIQLEARAWAVKGVTR